MPSVRAIPEALLPLLPGKVFHFSAHKEEYPHVVWAEENVRATSGDDKHAELSVSGSVRYYTRTEYDGMVDAIQAALDAAYISNTPPQIAYYQDMDCVEYLWDWEVICGDGKIY